MSDYRRWLVPGATYFFTVVTYQRRLILGSEEAVRLLSDVMREVRKNLPFHTIAMVVLPDHIHCVWSLPPDDLDFSTRWKKIKREFTVHWVALNERQPSVSSSRRFKGERGVWQRRFWEHLVRDEANKGRPSGLRSHGESSRPGRSGPSPAAVSSGARTRQSSYAMAILYPDISSRSSPRSSSSLSG
ncbi:MAG: REP-associated tyrosine transposase [Isosphaeraceae bacterium]